MNMKSTLAFLILVLALPNLAPAQTEPEPEQRAVPKRFVYEWTDDKGVVHLTDDPGQVPRKYRGNSLKKSAEPRREEGEKPEGGAVRPAPNSSDEELEQRWRKDEWQQRYLDWKDKLQQAEQRYQSLLQRRTDLIAPWGSPCPGAAPGGRRVRSGGTVPEGHPGRDRRGQEYGRGCSS